MQRDNGGFDLRPPKHWPLFADAMRRSLQAGAGRVARLWVEELVPPDGPARLLVGAELRGSDADEVLSDEQRAAVADDLRRRLQEDAETDAGAIEIAVFAVGERDGLTNALRATEPIFGEARHRFMNLAELRQMFAVPRTIPKAMPVRKEQDGEGEAVGAMVMILVVAALLAGVVWWLVPWPIVQWICYGLVGLVALALCYTTYLEMPRAALRRPDELKRLPMTLASVVQAFEALLVASHPDYPHGARFGLVAVFTLDSRRRDDVAWLNWMSRRLAWLRDHGADDPDETRVAQRLESEADDGTSKLPPSVSGNDATYWFSPMVVRQELPGERLPGDGLLPILLPAEARPGDDAVRPVRLWPAELWPLRYRPPWANRPDDPDVSAEDDPADDL